MVTMWFAFGRATRRSEAARRRLSLLGRRPYGMDTLRDPHPPSLPGSAGATMTVPCCHSISDTGLLITEVRISPRTEDKLKAFVSITLNNCFVVRGIKVIEGRERLFVAMPSRAKSDGSFQDTVHPINQETRTRMEEHILSVFHEVMANQKIQ